MCGISGIFGFAGARTQHASEVWSTANQQMVDHQRDRGPDAQGTWNGSAVHLGHTRLGIMDPSNSDANQPVSSADWVLAYNGEIYNFRELRDQLSAAGRIFRTKCDTEVLLQALDHWGLDESLQRISGIFAFAAYDQRADELHLVRDRLGVKPLYFHCSDEACWFASTPAAIARVAQSQWELDYAALYSLFRLGAPCGRPTLFSGIERLQPAEWITFTRDGSSQRQTYWTPQPRGGDLKDAVEAAARRQHDADVPAALFLSGGVDSTVLAGLYRSDDQMGLFHLDSTEREFAEYVADHVGHALTVREHDGELDFETFNRSYAISSGEASASAPIPWLIAQAIREAGFKVAFSANGADELFLGYPRTLTPELHPGNEPANLYDTLSSVYPAEQINHIFRHRASFTIPRARETTRSMERDRWPESLAAPLVGDFPPSAHARWLELQTYVAFDLNPTLDFTSMAASLEVRVPFLDHELVETALSHDANDLIAADYGRKAPLKRMLKADGIHPGVWARVKMGFSLPPAVLARRQSSLAASRQALARDGYLKVHWRCRPNSRDDQYLGAAGHAFDLWKREWIDSGIVSP